MDVLGIRVPELGGLGCFDWKVGWVVVRLWLLRHGVCGCLVVY